MKKSSTLIVFTRLIITMVMGLVVQTIYPQSPEDLPAAYLAVKNGRNTTEMTVSGEQQINTLNKNRPYLVVELSPANQEFLDKFFGIKNRSDTKTYGIVGVTQLNEKDSTTIAYYNPVHENIDSWVAQRIKDPTEQAKLIQNYHQFIEKMVRRHLDYNSELELSFEWKKIPNLATNLLTEVLLIRVAT